MDQKEGGARQSAEEAPRQITYSRAMTNDSITNSKFLRAKMVDTQLLDGGISDVNVLRAMLQVPREKFVRSIDIEFAYDDSPLTIGSDQTISQPFMVAVMIEALRLQTGDKVLEIGAGSGYAAAVLSEITKNVFAIERIRSLVELAKSNLAAAGYNNVQLRHGDGTEGWPEASPFDAILVCAGAPHVPRTLEEQLKIGGRMIIPIGKDLNDQILVRITRTGEEDFKTENLGHVHFVPLIGDEGWHIDSLGRISDGLDA